MPAKSKKLDFETAMIKLEEIVDKLESEEFSIEEAIKNYEEGVRLARFCVKYLDETEKKVEELIKGDGGKNIFKPWNTDREGA
ncbi:MAG: exodeoxyribonuclease VII small subunit [Desulfobacteraceae bacterium]|nr:exodeoxyribonuclease VII small subunit [Desulfobacteraceae bacterium]